MPKNVKDAYFCTDAELTKIGKATEMPAKTDAPDTVTDTSKRSRRLRLSALLVVGGLLLTACGSSDDSNDAANAESTEAVTDAAEPTGAAETAAEAAVEAESDTGSEAAAETESAVAPEATASAIDCPALRFREFSQAFGLAAAPGAIFLIPGAEDMRKQVAELPEMVKALRALEPYEQKVGTLPPLSEALDRLQQRADAAAGALDDQESTREAFNKVATDLQDELTLDIAALGSAMTKAGCPQ